MTIQIQQPELEALILDRMQTGAFESVEDVLLHALQATPPPAHAVPASALTGADLVAAMQASPCKEISLQPSRYPMPVRNIVF